MSLNINAPDPLDKYLAGKKTASEKLEVIARQVRRCDRCDLHVHRVLAVPGEGGPGARMMLVGEAPGRMEDAAGRPFIGKSGELLDRLLESASIRRSRVFITSVTKCRPVTVAGDKLKNRAPRGPEISACEPYLVRQIKVIRPQTIVCLGAVAARTLIDPRFSITAQRGEWFDGPCGSRILATFHPAYILRQGGTSKAAEEFSNLAREDFRKARQAVYGRSS